MQVKKVENETAVEARYQFYKETTQVDPVTEETVVLNIKDEWPTTRAELVKRKAEFDKQSIAIQAKIDAIDAL